MNNEVAEILKGLIVKYGTNLSDDLAHCKSLLLDGCGDRKLEAKLEVYVLTLSIQEGIPSAMFTSMNVPLSLLKKRFTEKLCSKYGLANEVAAWAVEAWAYSLDLQSEIQELAGKNKKVRNAGPKKVSNTKQKSKLATVLPPKRILSSSNHKSLNNYSDSASTTSVILPKTFVVPSAPLDDRAEIKNLSKNKFGQISIAIVVIFLVGFASDAFFFQGGFARLNNNSESIISTEQSVNESFGISDTFENLINENFFEEPTYYIESIDAEVLGLKFFEGGQEAPKLGERTYNTNFSRADTRFIRWEIALKHSAPGEKMYFDVNYVYYNLDGSIIANHSFERYIDHDWVDSLHWNGYGWTEPGNWRIGTYYVEIIIDDVVVASGEFEIREE